MISFEQFKTVLPNAPVRDQLGLKLTDEQAQYLLQHEAESIGWYEAWTRLGQRPSDGSAPAADPHRMSGVAVAGFICNLVALVALIGSSVGSAILLIVGLILAHFGMGETNPRKEARRGRGLAIVGVVLGWVAVLVLIGVWIGRSQNGAILN